MEQSQAEVKLRKLREPLTDNADGNPEPSSDNREGAETRHGVCLTCGSHIIDRQKTAKYCSKECKKASRRKHPNYKVCTKCGNPIPKGKNSNAKYCSSNCREAYGSMRHAIRKGRIKNPGVGSGGNQWSKNNHMYKTGIGTYNRLAFSALPNKCNRCSSVNNLLVHHIDHNRTNNDLSNLEILCKRCHQNHHHVRGEDGRYISPQ